MKQILFFITFLLIAAPLVMLSSQLALAQQDIVVRAQVGSIVAGPSSEADENDEDKEKKKDQSAVAPVSQPSVSVEPATLNGAAFTMKAGMPEFTTSRPAFQGSTNIQDAKIALVFSYQGLTLKAFTQADKKGDWSFFSPEDFPNGRFELLVEAYHPTQPSIKAETKMAFSVSSQTSIRPWTEKALIGQGRGLYELQVTIQEPYQAVTPGENILAFIEIEHLAPSGKPVEVPIEYRVQDALGRDILFHTETIFLDKRIGYFKTFYTQPDMKRGKYQLIVSIPSEGSLVVGATPFRIQGRSALLLSSLAKVDYTVVLQGVGVIFIGFVALSYFEFIRFLKIRKRIHMVRSKILKKFIKPRL